MNIKEFRSFLTELELNNNRDWFQENKKRYEKFVKEPFAEFATELIKKVQEFDPKLETNLEETLFRINRDIRFSKDKTPYNTIIKAALASGGRKSGNPGYYIGISKDYLHLGGGHFNLDKDELKRIREKIAQNSNKFIEIVRSNNFRSNFGELKGERAKRIDKEFKEIGEKLREIYLKQFYAMKEIPLENDKDLLNLATTNLELIKPLINFMRK